jgi:ribosomal protein L37AE/L43A
MVLCPECGSENIRHDTEFDDMWCCMDCNHRFPKEEEIDREEFNTRYNPDREEEEDLRAIEEEWFE